MKTKKILTGLCLLNGITISTLANSQVSIDLANDDGKTLAKPSASSVTVTIKNMLPTAGYSKYIKHYYPEIAGLPKPDMSNIPGAPALGVKVASQPSEDMDDNAGIMEGKSLFGGVEKAAGDGISPDEIAPLVVDYLSTNIKNECYALFSKSISDVYAADSEKALSSEVDKLNATYRGPRFGLTLLAGDIINEIDGPLISQFGWQEEIRVLGDEGQAIGLIEFIGLVGGMEQGYLLPSLTTAIGYRNPNGFEAGFGPNISLAGVGYAFSLGFSIQKGGLVFPQNISLVLRESSMRISYITGFNSYSTNNWW